MNTRLVLSAAFAASLLLAPMLVQAQAPVTLNEQKLEVKVESLQAQVNALQAQVKRLQAQMHASSPSGVISPSFQFPNLQIPEYQAPPLQFPGTQSLMPPNIQTFTMPPYILPGQRPQPYSNIPPCSLIFINQKTR